MKGYGITIKNDLLEPKHCKKMGSSVWEYMWLIDKMTSISEEGIGKILGGRPIQLKEISLELGKAESTVSENLSKLEKEGYTNIVRAPYGLVITVNKAWKNFGKRVRKSEGEFGKAKESSEKPKSNIRQYKDNTIDNTINTAPSAEITKIFEIFQTINPTINYGNTTQRKAVVEMIKNKNIGFEKTKGAALYAVSVFKKQYAPVITTPYQLKEKLSALIAYHEKDKGQKINIINLDNL